MYLYLRENHLLMLCFLFFLSWSCTHSNIEKKPAESFRPGQTLENMCHPDSTKTLGFQLSQESFWTLPIDEKKLHFLPACSWKHTESALNKLSWMKVYQFRNKLKTATLNDESRWSEFLSHLDQYCEQRLRDARKEFQPDALLTLDDENYHDFFKKPVYSHRWKVMSWSEMYSLIKYGDSEAMEYFSSKIAEMMIKKHGLTLTDHRKDWLLSTPAGFKENDQAAKKASLILGEKVAKKLGIELAPVYLTKKQHVYYSDLDDALTRFDLAMTQYDRMKTHKKHLLIIDDAAVSGATFWAVMAAFGPEVKIHSACIVDVRCEKMSVEGVLNNASVQSPEALLEILRDENAEITSRTLLAVLSWDRAFLKGALASLSRPRLKTLYQTARSSHRIRKRDTQKSFQVIEKHHPIQSKVSANKVPVSHL